MSPNEVAGLVALGGGALVLTTQRGVNPAVPAIAAPIAVAWPYGAPALGAGVALGALTLARPRRLPGPALLVAIALAILIAVTGDDALVRGGAAAIAIAVVTPAFVRTIEGMVLAGVAFGLASAGVALGAAVAGVTGVRADVIAVACAAGLAASAATGARSISAANLAGVLALPSKAGIVAAAVAVIALLVVRRLPSTDAILAAVATAVAWLAGAPFAHAPWRHFNAFTDTYHRLGAAGVALFVLLLAATAWGLPRPLAPGLLAAAAGAIFTPLEATAPLWLLAGLAASSSSSAGPLRMAREEEQLLRRERELEAERQALAEEQRRLRRRRQALDEREATLANRERGIEPPRPPAPPPPPPPAPPPPPPSPVPPPPPPSPAPPPPPPPPEPPPAPPAAPPAPALAPPAPPSPPERKRRWRKRRPAPEPVAAPAPIPTAVPVAAAAEPAALVEGTELQPQFGHWNFALLQALAEERAAEFPDRIDEWRVYLDTLEPYVEDGLLPPAFDETVLDVFGPLVA